ncbi:MAG TPA: flagellar protein export ATPase FliI [Calditrichia bacterium]|nr:flagellar protein export ATPase FliI [Calditrichota bacterium]HQV31933.1 flagellar protein export ATPase FliI [Calditrichia bacterium]
METLIRHLENYQAHLDSVEPMRIDGRVSQIKGLVVEATAREATIGDVCHIDIQPRGHITAEVVGFQDERVWLMPLGETVGVYPGARVRRSPRPLTVPIGECLLGRIIDGLGRPIDGKGPLNATKSRSIYAAPPNSLVRQRIETPLTTGLRAIDGLLTLGKGQRVGIFAGSGVGKSVLMGMISRYTDADVNVIALIGERGREVREFLERDLGEEGLKRSVVVVATSDQASTVRVKGAFIATTIAEYFRDQGKDVLLLMDSLTRMSMAQREIGLAIGEPPTTKGYTPSVFAQMPRLLERAGTGAIGSITGLYTVLVEGGDLDEPISDTARSILDGHIVLSRKIATSGHYPAIDILESISRVRNDIISKEQKEASQKVLELMSVYREAEDLINIGAYSPGSNPTIDAAVRHIDAIRTFLRQDVGESTSFSETRGRLQTLAGAI